MAISLKSANLARHPASTSPPQGQAESATGDKAVVSRQNADAGRRSAAQYLSEIGHVSKLAWLCENAPIGLES